MCNIHTGPSAGIGNPIFLATQANRAQAAAPDTSGNIVRILGHQFGDGGTADPIYYFNPSPDFIEVA